MGNQCCGAGGTVSAGASNSSSAAAGRNKKGGAGRTLPYFGVPLEELHAREGRLKGTYYPVGGAVPFLLQDIAALLVSAPVARSSASAAASTNSSTAVSLVTSGAFAAPEPSPSSASSPSLLPAALTLVPVSSGLLEDRLRVMTGAINRRAAAAANVEFSLFVDVLVGLGATDIELLALLLHFLRQLPRPALPPTVAAEVLRIAAEPQSGLVNLSAAPNQAGGGGGPLSSDRGPHQPPHQHQQQLSLATRRIRAAMSPQRITAAADSGANTAAASPRNTKLTPAGAAASPAGAAFVSVNTIGAGGSSASSTIALPPAQGGLVAAAGTSPASRLVHWLLALLNELSTVSVLVSDEDCERVVAALCGCDRLPSPWPGGGDAPSMPLLTAALLAAFCPQRSRARGQPTAADDNPLFDTARGPTTTTANPDPAAAAANQSREVPLAAKAGNPKDSAKETAKPGGSPTHRSSRQQQAAARAHAARGDDHTANTTLRRHTAAAAGLGTELATDFLSGPFWPHRNSQDTSAIINGSDRTGEEDEEERQHSGDPDDRGAFAGEADTPNVSAVPARDGSNDSNARAKSESPDSPPPHPNHPHPTAATGGRNLRSAKQDWHRSDSSNTAGSGGGGGDRIRQRLVGAAAAAEDQCTVDDAIAAVAKRGQGGGRGATSGEDEGDEGTGPNTHGTDVLLSAPTDDGTANPPTAGPAVTPQQQGTRGSGGNTQQQQRQQREEGGDGGRLWSVRQRLAMAKEAFVGGPMHRQSGGSGSGLPARYASTLLAAADGASAASPSSAAGGGPSVTFSPYDIVHTDPTNPVAVLRRRQSVPPGAAGGGSLIQDLLGHTHANNVDSNAAHPTPTIAVDAQQFRGLCAVVELLERDNHRLRGDLGTAMDDISGAFQQLLQEHTALRGLVGKSSPHNAFRERVQQCLAEVADEQVTAAESVQALRGAVQELRVAVLASEKDKASLAADVLAAKIEAAELNARWRETERRLLQHETVAAAADRRISDIWSRAEAVERDMRGHAVATDILLRRNGNSDFLAALATTRPTA